MATDDTGVLAGRSEGETPGPATAPVRIVVGELSRADRPLSGAELCERTLLPAREVRDALAALADRSAVRGIERPIDDGRRYALAK